MSCTKLFLLMIWAILRLQLEHFQGNDEVDPVDLEAARLNEARRRLRMLGLLVESEYNYDQFRERSRQTLISMSLLKTWHEAYRKHGLGGLFPDWEPLSPSSMDRAGQQQTLLGELADAEIVADEDIEEQAAQLGWRVPRLRDWLLRYRRGGLWGLAPEYYADDPHRPRPKGTTAPPRMPGSLLEKDLADIERRTLRLGWLLEQARVSDDDVKQRAEEAGCATRTLWYDLQRHRQYGPLGLARDERSDKGGKHADDWYTDIIIAARLSKKDATVNWVYDEVCRRARRRGVPEPSRWRVRSTCEQINGSVKSIADGREDAFRNKYRFAGRLKIDGVVYEIDHTPVDVLVKDLRSQKYRTKSGLTRPYLTVVIEANSRLIVAAIFTYDHPDRFTIAEVIRRALIVTDRHPYGGIPGEIWIDQGEELNSRHVTTICWALKIKLHPTYCPEHKPHVERFFGTLNTRLWSNQKGYTDSSVAQRNPNAERDAELTISDLEDKFWKFINDEYHKEIHSELGMSPPAFWDENCFTAAADPRQLDVLMMEPEHRKVSKGRISFPGRKYFHPALATLVGDQVLVRRPTHYGPPEAIEVYKNGQWICTAVALDSELADTITASDVRDAQRVQRRTARAQINSAKAMLATEDHQHGGVTESAEDAQRVPPAPSPDSSASSVTAIAASGQGSEHPKFDSMPKPPNGQVNFLRRLGKQAKNKDGGRTDE